MPQLRDTEWRLLCVIVRQTLGWRGDDGNRRQSDWLTHSQLKRRTGRASAALSAALDRLVTLGMVDVSDGRGRVLAERDQRRRAYTRLYYRLSGRWSSGSPFSEIENLKAKTTKESGTKVEIAQESSESEELMTAQAGLDVPSAENFGGREDKTYFVREYVRLYGEYFQRKCPEITASDLALLKIRLGKYGPDYLQQLVPRFFSCNLFLAVRHHHSFGSFLNSTALLSVAS